MHGKVFVNKADSNDSEKYPGRRQKDDQVSLSQPTELQPFDGIFPFLC